MANKESTFGNAISLRQYLNDQLSSDGGYSNFMKITNINNINAIPYAPAPVDPANPQAGEILVENNPNFGIGDYIHDVQLVWVGDRFYLQGKKIYKDSGVETFSSTYLFPFDAIAVAFENKVSDYTIVYDLNLGSTGVEATITKKADTFGTNYPTLLTAEDITITTANGKQFDGWYLNPEGTGEKITSSKENVINGYALYANWVPQENENNE